MPTAESMFLGGSLVGGAFKKECEDYLLYEVGRKGSTVSQYVARWGYLETRIGKPIETITCGDIRTLKRSVITKELQWSRNHFNAVLSAWKVFRGWGALENLWDLNGDRSIPALPVDDEEDIPPLPVEKVAHLLQLCRRPLEFRLIYYAAYAGTRIGESAVMSGSMWQDGWLRFRGEKNSRMVRVPIHPRLEEVRWDLLASRPTYDSSLQRVKRQLASRAGFPFKSHQIRKTFSTMLHDAGVTNLCRNALLGHSLGLDGVYVRVGDREKQEAIAEIDY